MSGFNSVDDFYDVMARRHGLHESERGGGDLELYSYNGAEFPDGLDGSSLDVVTAPSPELLAYMRGNDSPVPPSGYKDMADEIKGIWDVYNHGSAEADWGRLAENDFRYVADADTRLAFELCVLVFDAMFPQHVEVRQTDVDGTLEHIAFPASWQHDLAVSSTPENRMSAYRNGLSAVRKAYDKMFDRLGEAD